MDGSPVSRLASSLYISWIPGVGMPHLLAIRVTVPPQLEGEVKSRRSFWGASMYVQMMYVWL
jgi:hypothetical protein